MELHPLVTFFIFSIPEAIVISIFSSALLNKFKEISFRFIFTIGMFIASSFYITHLSIHNILLVLILQVTLLTLTLLVFYEISIIESLSCVLFIFCISLAVQSTIMVIFNGYIPKNAVVTEKGNFIYELLLLIIILAIEICTFALLSYICIKKGFKLNVRTTKLNIILSKQYKIMSIYIISTLLSCAILSSNIIDIMTTFLLLLCMSTSCFIFVITLIKSFNNKSTKNSITDKRLREIRLDFEHNLGEMASQLKKGEYDKVYESVLYWQDLVSIEFENEGGGM